MAITKVSRGLLNTGVSDSSDSTAITIDSSENVGIGETSPLGKLHVKSGESSGSADANADELVIEGSGNHGIQFLGSNSSQIQLLFGDNDDSDVGYLNYNHSNNSLSFGVNAAERFRIDSNGNLGLGTSSPSMKLNISHGDQDGLRFNVANTAETFIDFGDTDDNDVGRISYDHADNHMAFRTNAAERMRIDSSGQVGINTTSPNAKLHISTADSTTFNAADSSWHTQVIKNDTGAASNASGLAFYTSANGYHVNAGTGIACVKNGTNSDYGADLVFITRPQSAVAAERMRIDSSGKVGIGTTSPHSGYKVSIDANATHGLHIGNIGGSYSGLVTIPDSSNNYFPLYIFNSSGNGNGYILSNSSGTTFSQSGSDIAFKENVKNWDENVLESFKNIKPSTFTYKSDENKKEIKGYIAQNEVDKFPEAYPINPIDGKHWFNPSGMTVYLMKAIQEQQEIIDDLKARIEVLEA